MKVQVFARLVHLGAIVALWVVAQRVHVFWGLKYALGMAVLWFLLEIAIRINPRMLNNPSAGEEDGDRLMALEPKVIGNVVAPVCIGASIATALLGLAITGLLASSPNLAKDVRLLVIPSGPMMVGIPLYLIFGRLGDLAASIRSAARVQSTTP